MGRADLSGAKGIIEEEAPELEALLSELLSSLKEVRSRIGPLVKEVSKPFLFHSAIEKPVSSGIQRQS